jgi:hypothetical protein
MKITITAYNLDTDTFNFTMPEFPEFDAVETFSISAIFLQLHELSEALDVELEEPIDLIGYTFNTHFTK